ncbi:hypothetical protein PaeCFBP13512_12665 [Paenibacillus sp. CFBP13512]|uniref:hypothetical protein n=1 Tax=Paenibacillus sp. CFBP13512 TaxID=2184007 RepID=UPI0010BF66F3|nr:hypothetical protein [Paenibacillus sp. CFBP13512]TKJ90678.1 hypothetical protein PaeCFBP13512_12665 [Paenibacillus sp. CFBP13512]
MNGELHQQLLITALGNAYLIRGTDATHPELTQHESIHVQFKYQEQSWTWIKWLEYLRETGYQRLMLVSSPAPSSSWQSSGFAGGGTPIGIRTIGTALDTLWRPSWQVHRLPAKVTWDVSYTAEPYEASKQSQHAFKPLSEYIDHLQHALQQISDFAEQIDQRFWQVNFFDPAIVMLTDATNAPKLTFELPEVYAEEAYLLLNAVYKAWVFGGMGSWNDEPANSAHSRQLEQSYNQLSAQLYHALLQCAQGAVNSVVL